MLSMLSSLLLSFISTAIAARARERNLQLAGEEYNRYYTATAPTTASSSALSMVTVPSREGYLRLV